MPKSKLTDLEVRKAKPRAKAYKLSDGGALWLQVNPSGSKKWRYRYRIGGVENVFALGDYETMSLEQARKARDKARQLVKEGIHPAESQRVSRQTASLERSNTFAALAQEWVDKYRSRWTPGYARQVETVLANDVLPAVGDLPIRSVNAAAVLSVIDAIQARGAPSIALLARQWMSGVFRHAISTLRADTDPTVMVRGAVVKPKTKHHQPLAAKELGPFLDRLEASQSSLAIKLALRLLLLTFVRPGELRQARWEEFDLDAAEWRIPGSRMKMGEEHVVPLSTQAVELLRQLKSISGKRPQLFPNVRDPKREMSPTTLNRVLERMGYAGRFSAHGFRSTASTILNEMGYLPDVIERQLAHKDRNKVRASYNQASYMAERREMMQRWADLVDGAQAAGNVVPIRKGRA